MEYKGNLLQRIW